MIDDACRIIALHCGAGQVGEVVCFHRQDTLFVKSLEMCSTPTPFPVVSIFCKEKKVVTTQCALMRASPLFHLPCSLTSP
jgi:hypothetical protein